EGLPSGADPLVPGDRDDWGHPILVAVLRDLDTAMDRPPRLVLLAEAAPRRAHGDPVLDPHGPVHHRPVHPAELAPAAPRHRRGQPPVGRLPVRWPSARAIERTA